MRCVSILFIVQVILFSFSLCELSRDKQESFLNDLLDYLNNLPNQSYVYEDGIFLKSSNIAANTYTIDIRAKAYNINNESYSYQRCTATILDLEDNGITIPNNEYQCMEWVGDETTPVTDETSTDVGDDVQVTEPVVKEPIQLDNEVQPDNVPTSGEQFIAIPRDRSRPCIGCSTHVDPSAAGVAELAALGARHLDKHEPNVNHIVIAVNDVERVVQVVNGIRYILTLTIGYNNCTDNVITESCAFDKTCKVSVITKPWIKFPDGSKYKAIVANNCTEQWLFGDDGEPMPETMNENKPTPDHDKLANSGSTDEILKVHTTDVQAQQHTQELLSNDELKHIEEQIIPYSEFNKSDNNNKSVDNRNAYVVDNGFITGPILNKSIQNTETVEKTVNPEKAVEHSTINTNDIDALMNLYNFADYQPLNANTEDLSRGKRSYFTDLQVMSVLEKFKKIKRNLNNAEHIYKLGKFLVDYLNEMDMEVKTRVFKEVIFAEEEIEADQHFFYIRVKVEIPCDKVECDSKDTLVNMCNGVIDSTHPESLEVVDTFCYKEEKNTVLGQVKQVPIDDPILLKLTNKAIKKIEDDMHFGNALRVAKIINANTQKVSGTLTKISIILEFTDCDKTVPFYSRENCSTVQNLGTKICDVEIHERFWIKDIQITYTCTDRLLDETIEENVAVSQNKYTKDPKVMEIVNEALQILEVQSNKNNKQKIVEITSVSTQTVAGQLINVNFVVGYTKCLITDIDIDAKSCDLVESERMRKCQAQVWERPWLQEGRQMKVVCDDTNITESNEVENRRRKRSTYLDSTSRPKLGGEKEVDATDPNYMELAQESLSKYLQDTGNTNEHRVVKIDKVKEQVVAGKLILIDFTVSPQDSEEVFSCKSKVWSRPWLKSKEINVTCEKDQESRQKRQLVGGETEFDPNNQEYMKLAQQSLSKYLQDTGKTNEHRVVKIEKVTVQVVAGTLTRIYFKVSPQGSEEVFSCKSKVWERTWLEPSKEINVTCDKDQESRRKRQTPGRLPGGKKDADVTDPKYMELAQESLSKYLQDTGKTNEHRVLKIEKVSEQVVSGTKTVIDFVVSPHASEEVFSCHSEVWNRPWLKSKEITVTCEKDQESRQKRQILGGKKEVDLKDPKYMSLAQQSLAKYLQDSGNTKKHQVVEIEKVAVQTVAGELTYIDFKVSPEDSSEVYSCHSEVWERAWLHKTEVTNVTCSIRMKREAVVGGAIEEDPLVGGPTEKDPTDEKYTKLAQKSLSKYLQDTGNTKEHQVVKIEKVTVQVVAGTLTRIDFKVSTEDSSEVYSCQSEVWERPWLNETVVMNVTCSIRTKREAIVGGAIEEDPTNEKYIKLAEESLNKYVENIGNTKVHKLMELNRVMKQLVSGTITSLDFVISPTNCDIQDKSRQFCDVVEDAKIRCHSDIWERPWLKNDNKIIDVKCDDLKKDDENADNQQADEDKLKTIEGGTKRKKTQFVKKGGGRPGGAVEQDPTKPMYRVLADEALRKYQLRKRSSDHHEITQVKRVATKVVSGIKYILEFEALRVSCQLNEINKTECDQKNNVTLTCHAVIWSRPWLKTKEINVGCSSGDSGEDSEEEEDASPEETKIKKRAVVLGGTYNKDPNDPIYITLASEAVKKYQKKEHADYMYKVNTILRATEKVASGIITNLDFTISPTTCLISSPLADINDCQLQEPKVELRCSAEIYELAAPRITKIKVGCRKPNKKKNKEQTTQATPNREKRESPYDDDYVDEDIKYYYADRAINDFNSRASTNNLYKVVSIHDVHRSVHMDTLMVRMYLEIAMTFCMRYGEEHDLQNCDEIDGMSHKLCLARVYPSPDDELVVQHATMTCDDDKQFESISGMSIDEFIRVSIAEIEKSPDIHYKLVPLGEPNVIPSLNYKLPIRMSFVVHHTNCTKDIDLSKTPTACVINPQRSGRNCHSLIYLVPNTRTIKNVIVKCAIAKQIRARRSVSLNPKNATADDLLVQKMVQESIEKLEMASQHKYKQRVLVINSYATKIVSGRLTTIDFDVGYTTCLKHEWVENITSCEFLEHLPRRHCISHVWERLWVENGRHIEVNCEDDETPLEAHIEFESAENAMQLANEALKHIEAKYPNPRRQKIVRIFSLEKQAIAGLHYRMKVEVGVTDCMALSIKDDCKLVNDMNTQNKFCRVNVWLRPWTDHPPSYRVTCDYQSGAMDEIYHQIQAERLFYDFLATYEPEYLNDASEMKNRFAIFKENVRKIHELNIYERGTARYAVTRFADLSYEEFSSRHLGLKPGLQDHNQVPMRMADIPEVELPDKYDWRDYGAVTPVKDQGSCGSCWAFSVTGNIEGQWKLQSGKLVSLSEQELVDCDDLDNGCNGGLPDNAYRAIEKLGGLETENDYPYEGTGDKCAYNKSLSRVHISGAVNITSNETDMAKWLTRNGPISIGINANAMQFYVGGISHPWKMLCNPKNLDHGVLVVGYGVKDYPLFHKHLPYWVVKNSWGDRWGEQGYYRVFRGDGTCGVNQMASSAVI